MLPTSVRYKDMVYSQDYARHFVPKITVQVIDTKARQEGSYTATSDAFYSNKAQLVDGDLRGGFNFGTLEDFQFLLDGSKRLMPNDKPLDVQCGWCSEEMSDDASNFDTPVVLTVQYPNNITTAGRTYYFDGQYDSVPVDFDIEYYTQGKLITMIPVRDSESYGLIAQVKVDNYDRIIFKVYRMSKPYRRIHMVEDIPGIYMSWDKTQVVSLSLDQQVDIYCREIIATELDFVIENAAKTLNILNNEGFEAYLRKRQPVEASLNMIFPDNTTEEIPLGVMKLAEWKVPKGSITANFVAYDAMDTLVLSEYIKGTFPATAVSFYDLAEAVLQDAGIADYTIDTELINLYTTAPLPIATHKELLRLIAQASQSLVLPQLNGGIHIKYCSPLIVATNFVKNPDFSNDWNNWMQHDSCEFTNVYIHTGKHAVKVNASGALKQDVQYVYGSHKYYCCCYATVDEVMTGSGAYFKINGENVSVNFIDMGLREGVWFLISTVYTTTAASLQLSVENQGSPVIVDSFLAVDLTVTYGAGNEPDVKWCDENIRFFTTQLMIPRYKGPNPVDIVDYSMMFETPEITTNEPLRSVTAKIYQYREATTKTEVYKSTHVINGTDTIDIRFSALAKEVEIEVKPESSTETAILLESTIYARAATLKIQASGNAIVTVKGKAVTAQVTEYAVDEKLDTSLILDARTVSIDNRLITNKTTAEDVTGYALYWYKRGYSYDFDWRQNPALEVLDTVVVQDDFDVNNRVLLTERTLDYEDGYLHGNSRGVC